MLLNEQKIKKKKTETKKKVGEQTWRSGERARLPTIRISTLHINRHFQVPNRSGSSASLHVSFVYFSLAVKSKGILKFLFVFIMNKPSKNSKHHRMRNANSCIFRQLKRGFMKITPAAMHLNGSHCSLKLLNFKKSKVCIKTSRCLCRRKEVVEESIL